MTASIPLPRSFCKISDDAALDNGLGRRVRLGLVNGKMQTWRLTADVHILVVGFSQKLSPMTSRSMCVRRKQSIASSGEQTMGSFSLKLVLTRTGRPVRASNARSKA